MKIYKTGKSAVAKLLANKCIDNEYVCVLECVNSLPLEEAYNIMCNELSYLGVIEKDFNKLTITVDSKEYKGGKDTYTLAHERSFDKKCNLILTPSNLLRFIFTRNFTKEALYIDENNEIIDLADGVNDSINGTLRTLLPFDKLITADNSILTETMFKVVKYNHRLHPSIDNILYELPKTVRPLSNIDKWMHLIIDEGYFNKFTNWVANYPELKTYIYEYSGLKSEVTFAPTEKGMQIYQQAIDNYVDKPVVKVPPKPVKGDAVLGKTVGRRSNPYSFKETRPGLYEQIRTQAAEKINNSWRPSFTFDNTHSIDEIPDKINTEPPASLLTSAEMKKTHDEVMQTYLQAASKLTTKAKW